MPPLDSPAADAGSSTDVTASSTEGQQSQQSSAPDVTNTESSTSQPDQGGTQQQGQQAEQKPVSVLEAVKQGMQKERAAAEAQANGAQQGQQDTVQPPKADGSGEKKDGQQQAEGEEPKPESLHPKTQHRIRSLVAQTKELTPKAQNWTQLTQWVEQNGLTQQEFEGALELMALLKHNPVEAHKRLQPMLQQTARFVGEALPDDLQEAVDQGRVSEDAARELAARRAQDDFRRQRETEQAARQREQQAYEQQQQQVQQAAQAVGAAVTAWEGEWKQTDPDYARKQPLVSQAVSHLIATRGAPATPEAAVALAKEARERVEEHLRTFLPKPRHQVPPTGGSSARAAAAPSNSLEAAKRALSGT